MLGEFPEISSNFEGPKCGNVFFRHKILAVIIFCDLIFLYLCLYGGGGRADRKMSAENVSKRRGLDDSSGLPWWRRQG